LGPRPDDRRLFLARLVLDDTVRAGDGIVYLRLAGPGPGARRFGRRRTFPRAPAARDGRLRPVRAQCGDRLVPEQRRLAGTVVRRAAVRGTTAHGIGRREMCAGYA